MICVYIVFDVVFCVCVFDFDCCLEWESDWVFLVGFFLVCLLMVDLLFELLMCL